MFEDDERVDVCWLLDLDSTDDGTGLDGVAVVTCAQNDGVTVTVTVGWGQLPHSSAGSARGTAAVSPIREARKILECILSKK